MTPDGAGREVCARRGLSLWSLRCVPARCATVLFAFVFGVCARCTDRCAAFACRCHQCRTALLGSPPVLSSLLRPSLCNSPLLRDMLSLSKQHLQQHAALQRDRIAQQAKNKRHAERDTTAATAASSAPSSKAQRAEALAAFPLAAATAAASSSSKTAKGTAKAKSLQKTSFAAQSARRAAQTSSSGALKRAKALERAAPRPTLLEKAARSLEAHEKPEERAQRNIRMLSHESERKKKTQEAMKKVSGNRTRHKAERRMERDVRRDRETTRSVLTPSIAAAAVVLCVRVCADSARDHSSVASRSSCGRQRR